MSRLQKKTGLNFPQLVGNSEESNLPQLVADLKDRRFDCSLAETSKEPIGVSEYEWSNMLPTPEEIEKELLGGIEI